MSGEREKGGRWIRELSHGSGYYGEAVALREEQLRRPLGLVLAKDELESEVNCRHFGLYAGETLLACLMVVPREGGSVQIRQMVVQREWQGRGLGRELMQGVEGILKDDGVREIYLNARATAMGFYKKLGYRVNGDIFTEVGIPHVRMEKGKPS